MKRESGVTLLELILAMGILLIIMVPMFNIFYVSTRNNVIAYRIKTATLIAQQHMEEFVGLNQDEVGDWLTFRYGVPSPPTDGTGIGSYNTADHYAVSVALTRLPTHEAGYDALRAITITVRFDGNVLCEQRNLINVTGG